MQIASVACSLAVALISLCPIAQAQDTDLCAIDRTVSQFCGKMITVRATTWHSVDGGGLENAQCRTVLSSRTPEDSGVHVRFKLKRDESWQTFTKYDAMSSELHYYPSTQPNYVVTATFHGQFVCDKKRRPWYFLVVESVSDVKVEPD
jgi:hypothetical protein